MCHFPVSLLETVNGKQKSPSLIYTRKNIPEYQKQKVSENCICRSSPTSPTVQPPMFDLSIYV